MSDIIRIEHIARHVGQTVTLQGWLQLKTGKGKLQFLRVRDGAGVIQAVVFRGNVSEEDFEAAKRMPLESSLIITGTVKADERAPGIPGGFELDVTGLQTVQESAEYPIAPKEHGVEFLMDNRHLWLRSNRQWAILRVRATIIKAMRDWLDDNGFTLVDTPILTPSAAEGTTTLFKTDFHGEDAFLAQTGQLYNEANIFAVGKTYCFGPTFRAEKSKTRRHLQEFWMVEPEIAFCKLEGLLEIEEQYVSYIVQTTLAERAAELKLLERDTTALEKVIAPFPRISYDDAVRMINEAAARGATVPPNDEPLPPIEWGGDFGAPHETFVASQFDAAGVRPSLPHRGQGILHGTRARPAGCVPFVRSVGAGGLRRDHRRLRAHERSGRAAGRHRPSRAAARGVRMVRGSAPLRLSPALRLRLRHRAHGGVDLRPRPHPRDDRVPQNVEPPEAVDDHATIPARLRADFCAWRARERGRGAAGARIWASGLTWQTGREGAVSIAG